MKVVDDDSAKKKKERKRSTSIVDCCIGRTSFLITTPGQTATRLPIGCIRRFAKSICGDLSDDVLTELIEDVNFELRSVLSSALSFMKHQNRELLTVEDFNKGISMLLKPATGYMSLPLLNNYRTYDQNIDTVNTNEISVNLVSIVNSPVKTYQTIQPYVECSWGVFEHKARWPCRFDDTFSFRMDPSENIIIPDELGNYFKKLSETIYLGDMPTYDIFFADLQVNPHIVPLLAILVDFLKYSIDILKMYCFVLAKLLKTIEALFLNPYIYMGHEPFFSVLTNSVIDSLIMPLPSRGHFADRHWIIRDSAAKLLAQIVNEWASPINRLYQTTFDKLERVYKNFDDPITQPQSLCSHYGALKGIMAFGVEAMEKRIYPYMPDYIVYVHRILRVSSRSNAQIREEAQEVYNTLLEVAVQVTSFHNKKILEMKDKCDSATATNQIPFRLLPCRNVDLQKNEDKFFYSPKYTTKKIQEKVNELIDTYDMFFKYFGSPFTERIPFKSLMVDAKSILSKNGGKNELLKQNFGTNNIKLLESFKKVSIENSYLKNIRKNALSQVLHNELIPYPEHDNYANESNSFNDSTFEHCGTDMGCVSECISEFNELFSLEDNECDAINGTHCPSSSSKPISSTDYHTDNSSSSNTDNDLEESDRCTDDDGLLNETAEKPKFEIAKISGKNLLKLTLRIKGEKK